MSLFQSALDFLAGPGSLGAASRDQNDFVGQTVEMGDMKLRIKRVIAEGKSGRQGRDVLGGPWRYGAGMGFPAGLPLPFSPSPIPRPGGFPPWQAAPGWGRAGGAAVPASGEGLAVSVSPAPLRAEPSRAGVPRPGGRSSAWCYCPASGIATESRCAVWPFLRLLRGLKCLHHITELKRSL